MSVFRPFGDEMGNVRVKTGNFGDKFLGNNTVYVFEIISSNKVKLTLCPQNMFYSRSPPCDWLV